MSNAEKKRAAWMSVLACAATSELQQSWDAFEHRPPFEWLKKPEYGSVLLQGRIGGSGREYGVGQVLITRCSIRLIDGRIGVGYTRGRAGHHVFIAAMFDALMQTADAAGLSAARIVSELEAKRDQRRRVDQAKTEETRVDFTVGARE